MPHLSKKKLQDHERSAIDRQFLSLLRSSKSASVFECLLTETEKLMLAKRLAVMVLLLRDLPYRTISRRLSVSLSTIDRIDRDIQESRFNILKEIVNGHSQPKKISHVVEKVVAAVLKFSPPPYGRGRWKWLYEANLDP